MKVTLIAHTKLAEGPAPEYVIEEWMGLPREAPGTDADYLGEFAGRACYLSFDRPNPKTAENGDYLANILRQAHESVLEHSSASFYVSGVSRALSHELVRHRHLSFSQRSQRYVDERDAEFVTPPVLRDEPDHAINDFLEACEDAQKVYEDLATYLVAQGHPRKRAREAARAVLPNATETSFVVTGNLRAWRDVLRKRHHVAADREIQAFAAEVLRHLRVVAPASVQDVPDEPYGTVKEAS